jgi:branched-chain amino acid transport system ATP-binding protein
MSDIILQTTNLTKSFGGLAAVNRVDFKLLKGNIHAIIGPNGSGKTTFFNLLTGYYKPNGGKVVFKGEDITGMEPFKICKKGIFRSFQITAIYPKLSVLENVQIARFSNRGRSYTFFENAKKLFNEEACGVIEEVGLLDQKDVLGGKLSHGDRKRLELAIVLSNEPEVMLLDEPTAGMSPEETRESMKLIMRIGEKRGLTILFVEHDMSVVFGYARRVTVFHQGGLLTEGTPDEVKANKQVQNVYLGGE